jgi:hypothetical protein
MIVNRLEKNMRLTQLLVALIAMTLILQSSGCHRTTVVKVSDANAATQVITDTFQQWKSGSTVDDLRNAQPPVYVADDSWVRGYQLKDFSVEKPAETHGTNIRLRMKLRLVDLKGKESTHSINYLVTTTPAVTIAREDN